CLLPRRALACWSSTSTCTVRMLDFVGGRFGGGRAASAALQRCSVGSSGERALVDGQRCLCACARGASVSIPFARLAPRAPPTPPPPPHPPPPLPALLAANISLSYREHTPSRNAR